MMVVHHWMPLGCSFKTTDADSGKFRTTGAKGAAKPLVKLKSILVKGLETTASLWSPIAVAYNWVHQAAKIWITNQDLNCTLCVFALNV